MMETLEIIKSSKIIAIARGVYGDALVSASLALYEGGVCAFEVTFEQDRPDGEAETARNIALLTEKLPRDAVVGAGTVMTAKQVGVAREAGARFIISPNTSREVIEETKRLKMVSIPGALIPTEIAAAYAFGADIVKVFPAGSMGVGYFKDVKAPFKHIPLAAVAGITKENIGAFSKAGAVAFGISSTLYNKEAIASGDLAAVRMTAEELYRALGE